MFLIYNKIIVILQIPMVDYRIIVLFLTTICLSMMMANMLTLNFCIICMTADSYAYVEENIETNELSSNLVIETLSTI